MIRITNEEPHYFACITTEVLRDERLSWKAKGIFAYLWDHGDSWHFHTKEIAKHSPDGEYALTTGLRELEKYGYLEREQPAPFEESTWILNEHPGREDEDEIS